MYQNQNLQPDLAFAPKNGAVRSVNQPKSRSIYHRERWAKNCPTFNRGDGFLNHVFSPLINGYPKEIRAAKRIVKSIFSAAENLCQLYGIRQEEYSHLIYPQNIAFLIKDLQEQMAEIDKEINILIVTQQGSIPTLATGKTFSTKTTLYYLTVEPLYFLMQQAHRNHTAELLISVFCYFYQVGKVPFFAEHSSYLYYIYQMIYDWNTEEEFIEDQTAHGQFFAHINLIKRESDKLLKVFKDVKNLRLLNARSVDFMPETTAEVNLKSIAARVAKLNEKHPHRSITDSIDADFYQTDGEGRITIDHYVSFMWSAEDCMYDQLIEAVNAELQEYNDIDEPCSIQLFSKPQGQVQHDLSFEHEFFDLLNELSDNLYDFSHEKHH